MNGDRLRAQPVTQVQKPEQPPLAYRVLSGTFMLCILAVIVMSTIKFGMVLFG